MDLINVIEKKFIGDFVVRVKVIDCDEDSIVMYFFKIQQEMFVLDFCKFQINIFRLFQLNIFNFYIFLRVWVGRIIFFKLNRVQEIQQKYVIFIFKIFLFVKIQFYDIESDIKFFFCFRVLFFRDNLYGQIYGIYSYFVGYICRNWEFCQVI